MRTCGLEAKGLWDHEVLQELEVDIRSYTMKTTIKYKMTDGHRGASGAEFRDCITTKENSSTRGIQRLHTNTEIGDTLAEFTPVASGIRVTCCEHEVECGLLIPRDSVPSMAIVS